MGSEVPPRLLSVKIINRTLFVNGDPVLNYLLPLDNAWRVNDLADEIMRACAIYDVIAKYENARYLASVITKHIIREQQQGKGALRA